MRSRHNNSCLLSVSHDTFVFELCAFCHLFRVLMYVLCLFFFFQAEDGIRDSSVTGVQTCALPISRGNEQVAEASATCSFPRALRKASRNASSRDVWACTRRRSLAMSETSISASR